MLLARALAGPTKACEMMALPPVKHSWRPLNGPRRRVQKLREEPVPELQRSSLAPAVLRLKAAGIDSIMTYPWLDPPPAESAVRAMELLYALGALNEDAKCVSLSTVLCLAASRGCSAGGSFLTVVHTHVQNHRTRERIGRDCLAAPTLLWPQMSPHSIPISRPSAAFHFWCRACRRRLTGSACVLQRRHGISTDRVCMCVG